MQLLLSALADSVATASDEEILEDIREGGEDPETVGADVHRVLSGAVKAYKQRELRSARSRYEAAKAAIGRQAATFPADAGQRRALLAGALAAQPKFGAALTLQHRELKALTDEDVLSALEELAALGAFDDTDAGSRDTE
jgi:hypothetical protein